MQNDYENLDNILQAVYHARGLHCLIIGDSSRTESFELDHLDVKNNPFEALSHAESLQKLLNRISAHALDRYQCPQRVSELAQKVFDIPILFDLVFEKLSPEDLLTAMQVNRQFRDAIAFSPTLRRQMLLDKPLHSRFIFPPKRGWWGQSSGWAGSDDSSDGLSDPSGSVASDSSDSGNKILDVMVHFFGSVPKVGPRRKKMYVCNPPVTSMGAYMSCCSGLRRSDAHGISYPDEFGSKVYTVRNGVGLTMGDLCEAAATIFDDHEDCGTDAQSCDDLDEPIEHDIYFYTLVTLDSEDPALALGFPNSTRPV